MVASVIIDFLLLLWILGPTSAQMTILTMIVLSAELQKGSDGFD
jgi:hypothetical protein